MVAVGNDTVANTSGGVGVGVGVGIGVSVGIGVGGGIAGGVGDTGAERVTVDAVIPAGRVTVPSLLLPILPPVTELMLPLKARKSSIVPPLGVAPVKAKLIVVEESPVRVNPIRWPASLGKFDTWMTFPAATHALGTPRPMITDPSLFRAIKESMRTFVAVDCPNICGHDPTTFDKAGCVPSHAMGVGSEKLSHQEKGPL